MRRRLTVLFAVLATVLTLSTGPASASTPAFVGAGFTATNIPWMTASWNVPTLHCAATESVDAVVIGIEGVQIATIDGWNAATVAGCDKGRPWYRIQAWVNAVGGKHLVADARPGDAIQARLCYGASPHPTIIVSDLTLHTSVKAQLMGPSTQAAPSSYAGARVPNFSLVKMQVSVNGGATLATMPRARYDEWRTRTRLIETGPLWPDGMTFRMFWRAA
jgi:Peptidase A4 family